MKSREYPSEQRSGFGAEPPGDVSAFLSLPIPRKSTRRPSSCRPSSCRPSSCRSPFFRIGHSIPSYLPTIRKVLFLLFLNLILFSIPQYALHTHVYRGEIRLCGKSFHSLSLKYPVVLIDSRYYIPLQKDFLKGIGLDISDFYIENRGGYAFANKIHIHNHSLHGDAPKNEISPDIFNEISPDIFGDMIRTDDIQPLIATVYIDSVLLRSNYPLYLIGGVPYISPDDSNDFSVNSIDILWGGSHVREEALPAYFNVFDSVEQSKFVRNQGTAQTCWAYAACSLLEIKIALTEQKILNLSENHLIEYSPVPANAVSGGNWGFSSSYLTKLLGPVSEDGPDSRPLGYHVREYSEAYGTEEIKRAIKKNGAVLTSIYYGPETSAFYDRNNFSYYHNEERHGPTHELVLVGWDDGYPKEYFKQTPPGDGAFIAMNSFGTNFGNGGFFYISYYDDIATRKGVSIDGYDGHSGNFRVISRDLGGVTHYEGIPKERNLYAVQRLHVDKKSKIRGIGIYSNGKAIVSAYYSKHMPSSEEDLLFLGDVYFENAGYKTIESYQNLGVEDDFFIVLKYRSSKKFSVPIETSYPGIFYDIDAEPNTSFIGYMKNGILVSEPLEATTKKGGNIVLRLLVESYE